MPSQKRDFYRARASAERDAATLASEPNVAGLHEQIAQMYEAMEEELDREFPPGNDIAGKRVPRAA